MRGRKRGVALRPRNIGWRRAPSEARLALPPKRVLRADISIYLKNLLSFNRIVNLHSGHFLCEMKY